MNINEQYQQILGRPATPEEASYLQKFITEGNLDAGEIGQIIQSMPEYQQKQLQTNTDAYGQKLLANDQQFLGQAADRIGASVNSRFASLGRPVSSAMAASVYGQTGQLAGNLAQSRQSSVADFYGRGLERTAAGQQDYGQNSLNRGYQERSIKRQRDWDISDYYRQKNDYEDAKNASSGWNAITPEFATSALIGVGGKIASSYVGGRAGRSAANGGMFG